MGPPRRSFASSSARANGKSFDGDIEGGRDKFGEKRNGRYPREEGEDKYSRRPRDEDAEGRPRRDYDRKPKWAGDDGEESKPRTNKRFDQPWFRSERGGDALEESTREDDREWRRGGGRDRGWDRHAAAEAEPEWMDAPIEEEATGPPRTQEDFQRWRERMKSGKSAAEPTDQTSFTPFSPPSTAIEPKAALPQFFDEPDDSMDKFYTRLSEQKVAEKQQPAAKAHGKSKFAALFGPPPPDTQKPFSPEPTPQQQYFPPPREQSSSADPMQQMFSAMSVQDKPAAGPSPGPASPPSGGDDQAGFARILEMLQGRSNNPTPTGAEANQPRPPVRSNDSQPQAKSMSLIDLLNGGNRSEPPVHKSPVGNGPPSMSDLYQTSRSPVDQGHGRQSSQKDELLLNLLKQANQTPKPTPGPEQYGHRPMSGESLNRAALARNQMTSPGGIPDPAIMQRRENGRSDEPLGARFSDDISPHEYMARRQNSEPPMYDEQLIHTLRGGAGPKQGPPQPPGPPPGLGRPPGLDQMQPRGMPPPGWGGAQHLSQHQPMQPRQQQVPLPGMPGRPNIPPGYGLPPQQSQPPRPTQGAGPVPQRKYTGDPDMPMPPPPPGFGMYAARPPAHVLESMQRPPLQQQQFQMQGGAPEQQGSNRAFMSMYEDSRGPGPGPRMPPSGHNGVRGVGGPPMGGYR